MRRSITLLLALSLIGTVPALAGWEEGVAAFTSKNYQGAAAEFKKLVDQNPDGYRSHYMLGLSLEQLGRKEEALHHLRKAYDLNPNDLSIKVALGRAYFKVRRYGDVTKLLGTVDARALPGAQQAAFYQIRGQAKFKGGDSSGAAADFKQLARLKPNDAKIQYMYGTTMLSLGQTDQAIAALTKASSLAPGDADKKRALAQALVKKGRETRDKGTKKQHYFKASKLAGELVARDASYDNLILKISAELGAGLYGDAVNTGQQAVSKNSKNDWLAPYYLGQAYASNKQYAESEEPLNTALGMAPAKDKKTVWRQLGFTYEKQKKYAKGIEAYTNAGDQGGVARVKENEETDRFNKQVEEENKTIKAMEEEARKLEAELKALEQGGGGL